jgi:hypothetical protein
MMEWVAGAVVVIMLALYVWASRTANREVRKKVQPVIDTLFDTRKDEPRNKS